MLNGIFKEVPSSGNKFMQPINQTIDYYKVIMIGDSGTGKTSISLQYCLDHFNEKEANTIGVSYLSKYMYQENEDKSDKKLCKICIWDTAGQERFMSIVKLYYKQLNGIFCVYDVNNVTSLFNTEKWINESLSVHKDPSKVPLILFGNKNDIYDESNLKNMLKSNNR